MILVSLLLAGKVALASAKGGTPIVVGLLLPPDEPRRESIRRGAEMAVEEAGGGARLAVRGRQGAWGSDASEAALLVEEDGASGLLAPPSGGATHLVLQVAGRTAVPVASLSTDGSVTRTAVPWMVRVAPSTADQARSILGGVPARSWLAFVPEGRAGREATADLREAAGARSVAFVSPGEALGALLSSSRPEAVLLWLDPAAAGKLARDLRDAGFRGTLAGPAHLDSASFREAAGTAAAGVLVPGLAPLEPGFAARYRAAHGEPPDTTAALAHDATAFLIGLLRRGKGSGFFPLAASFPGATGVLQFDRSGNRIVRLELRRLAGVRGRG